MRNARVRNTSGKGKRLQVDHCHESGKIRGLLCDRCNRGLGSFKDDPTRPQKAIEYLGPRAAVRFNFRELFF